MSLGTPTINSIKRNILRVFFYAGILIGSLPKIGEIYVPIFILFIILSFFLKEKGQPQPLEIIVYRWVALLGVLFPLGVLLMLRFGLGRFGF